MTSPTEMKVRDPMKTDSNGKEMHSDKKQSSCCFGRLFKHKPKDSDLVASPGRDFDKNPIKRMDEK